MKPRQEPLQLSAELIRFIYRQFLIENHFQDDSDSMSDSDLIKYIEDVIDNKDVKRYLKLFENPLFRDNVFTRKEVEKMKEVFEWVPDRKNKELKVKKYTPEQVEIFKKRAAIDNIGLKPEKGYHVCNTCGTKGKDHPRTAYCFICDTDNW